MEANIKISEKAKKFCYKRIVLDASVLIKAFREEEDSLFVRELLILSKRKSLALLATPLILFEFLNVLSKEIKNTDEVEAALTEFLKLGIGLVPYGYGYLEKGIKAACETKASYYDSSYHALAKQMHGVLLTADEKYYELMKNEGNIMLLSKVAR